MADRSAYEVPHYSPERRELKQIVDQEVKSPPSHMKRRASIQNIVNILPFGVQPKKIQNEDEEQYYQMVKQADERKQQKLEWRAQFQELTDVPMRREKSEQQRIKEDLIRIVHTEESESKQNCY